MTGGEGPGRWGQPGGSLPSPDLSLLLCWREQSPHPPKGVLELGPPAQPQEGLVAQPRAICQEEQQDGEWETTPSGSQVAPCPICQHRGPSPRATCPLCPVSPARSAPHAPSPPNSCAVLAAVGALLFFRVTLEHKQLCSSSPVNYIMSNEQDQAEGIKP